MTHWPEGFRKAPIYIIPYHLKQPNLEKYCRIALHPALVQLILLILPNFRDEKCHWSSHRWVFPPRFHHSDPFEPRLACSGSFKVFNCTREPASSSTGLTSDIQKTFTPTHGSTNSSEITTWLVVSTPLKNIRQIGNLPQIGVNIKNLWNHHPATVWARCVCFRCMILMSRVIRCFFK